MNLTWSVHKHISIPWMIEIELYTSTTFYNTWVWDCRSLLDWRIHRAKKRLLLRAALLKEHSGPVVL